MSEAIQSDPFTPCKGFRSPHVLTGNFHSTQLTWLTMTWLEERGSSLKGSRKISVRLSCVLASHVQFPELICNSGASNLASIWHTLNIPAFFELEAQANIDQFSSQVHQSQCIISMRPNTLSKHHQPHMSHIVLAKFLFGKCL